MSMESAGFKCYEQVERYFDKYKEHVIENHYVLTKEVLNSMVTEVYKYKECNTMSELLKNIDCIEFYVSDLDDGIKYYCDSLGLKLLWRADTSVGLGMENDISEIVLQTDRKKMNVDLFHNFCG